MMKPLQPAERAGREQVDEPSPIGQYQLRRSDLGQRVEHERPSLHVIVRNLEARLVDQSLAEQQDIRSRVRGPQRSALRSRPCASSMRCRASSSASGSRSVSSAATALT